MLIDSSTEFGKRVEQRLRDEQIGWIVTVGTDGTPQPSPVWFLWDGFCGMGVPSWRTGALRSP